MGNSKIIMRNSLNHIYFVILVFLLLLPSNAYPKKERLVLFTGRENGTYYPVGITIKRI